MAILFIASDAGLWSFRPDDDIELSVGPSRQLRREIKDLGRRCGVGAGEDGVLVVDGDRMGRVSLRAGRVISARIEGSRRVNKPAIYELLSWSRGRFAFTQDDLSSAADEIGAPTTQLLMEAARRADEAAAHAS